MDKKTSPHKQNPVEEDRELKAPNQADVEKVINTLNPEQKKIITGALIARHMSFSGPLPSPEDFFRYGQVLSTAPERILCMAEKQIEHRISMEKHIVESGIKESKRGQWMGIALVVIFLLSATFLGYAGHDVLAGAIITLVVGVATIFVLRKPPKSENEGGDAKVPENETV